MRTAIGLLIVVVACRGGDRSAGLGRAEASRAPELAGAGRIAAPAWFGADDGEWRMATKDSANLRWSALDQINADNVQNLRLVWSLDTKVHRGHEAAPLVVGDTMYYVTPFPNTLLALDAATGAEKWRYQPAPSPQAQGVACCDVVNRGAVFFEGKIIYNTLDARTVAVDAATGKELWRMQLGDPVKGETITMAPMIARGKVLVGNSGGELGVRGWLTALDAQTGKIAWRAYSTGPDRDVLIGPDFKPFYERDRGVDLGVRTWPPEKWKIGGGTVWGFLSYDPELDLIYYGTANPGPWNPEQREGTNHFTAGVFARRPEDGRAVWFYQVSPHDLYDHDAINENMLLDLDVGGRTRKVLVRPERNGYVYVMDRVTGEVLSATPYGANTVSRGVDLATGELRRVPEKATTTGKVVREICPGSPGTKDWQPSSFSPRTGWLYIPHQNLCQDEEGVEANYIAGTPYVGANVRLYAGPGGNRGVVDAWDPVAARKVWSIEEPFPVWSGTVATAGDLVFYATMDGWFKAVHARTGALLWRQKLDSGSIGQPITFRAPDGKQRVAITSGVGGWPGAIVSGDLDAQDRTAGGGFAHVMADLPRHTGKGGTIYVFGLP